MTTVVVTTQAQLDTAIKNADAAAAGSGATTIDVEATITLTSPLEAINLASGDSLTIQGTNGSGVAEVQTLSGGGSQRGLFVYSGTVSIDNLTLEDMTARGGNGSDGGGGGAGLGGALFVTGTTTGGGGGAKVTLDNVSFSGDSAVGGKGAKGTFGGGGGMGGNGGASLGDSCGGGGGLGLGGDGGNADAGTGKAGIVPKGSAGGKGSGGFTMGAGGLGGASGGGGGAGDDAGGGGGGGIGGKKGGVTVGGGGGFGGGGGGGSLGGGGGFGGGGGGGTFTSGAGGFGGGGAGAGDALTGGAGGFGGGTGLGHSVGSGGGGGLGAGGDIFVQQGASLTIEGGDLGAGTVTGGAGALPDADGAAYGDGVFLQGNQTLTLAPGASQTLTVLGVIADMTGSKDASKLTGAGALALTGAGTVVLNANNTFTGGVALSAGTLELAAAGAAGTGTITLSGDPAIVIETAALAAGAHFANTIDGFSPGDGLDLVGLAFVSGKTTATYAGGVLSVTDGTHTDTLTLGDVANGVEFVTSDVGGGTEVVGENALVSVHWARDVSGNFTTAADWTGGHVPAAADAAVLDAAGSTAYTVTASASQTVAAIETDAPATLSITAGVFAASNTSDAGANAGVIALAAGATLKLEGSFDNTGTLSGAGTVDITGGTATFDAGGALTIAKVTEAGNATAASFGVTSLSYAGVWTQTGGTLSVASGDRVNFTGTGDSFEGTVSGAGTVAFIGSGSVAFTGAHLTAASLIVNGPTVTLSGALGLSGEMAATTGDLIIAAGGASLAGGGSLILSNLATNKVSGGTLTNVNDYIKGAGLLGDGAMVLVNDKGGIIDGDDSVALTIDTGSSTISNAGRIEAGSKGVTTISSAVDNTGVLGDFGGTLTLDGAVTGTGTAEIDGGTADFAGAFSQNVAFIGAGGGTLEIAHSQDYTGEITGFSKTGTTTLVLADIDPTGAAPAYTGTTTSGVLTIKNGSQIARITLEGDYLDSNFSLSAAPSGGTKVVDPARSAATANPNRFVAAMAGFQAPGMGALAISGDPWRPPPLSLSPPRALA